MSENGRSTGKELPAGGDSSPDQGERGRFAGPGGTAGGAGSLLLGLLLAAVGGYLIMNQAIVSSGYWNWFGSQTFGLTLVPLLAGLGVLFFDGRSALGWLLIIIAGILVNLHVYFRATTVYNAIIMFGLFAVGLGLMARSFRAS